MAYTDEQICEVLHRFGYRAKRTAPTAAIEFPEGGWHVSHKDRFPPSSWYPHDRVQEWVRRLEDWDQATAQLRGR